MMDANPSLPDTHNDNTFVTESPAVWKDNATEINKYRNK